MTTRGRKKLTLAAVLAGIDPKRTVEQWDALLVGALPEPGDAPGEACGGAENALAGQGAGTGQGDTENGPQRAGKGTWPCTPKNGPQRAGKGSHGTTKERQRLGTENGPQRAGRGRKPGRIGKPDALGLRHIVSMALTGDPLSRGRHTHDGAVDALDQYGMTKRAVYELVTKGDTQWFEQTIALLWSPKTRRKHTLATRTKSPKEGQPGKFRSIDAPAERARAMSWHVLDEITPRAKKHLGDNLIAYRQIEDVSRGLGLPDRVTIQDIFALKVQPHLRAKPFVVRVDLEDAFGNLPHGAIHEALKEIGLDRWSRNLVLDLVSIHARESNGKVTTSPGKGISLGNPLSPLVFNLTFGLLLRKVTAGSPWVAFAYGDDLVLLAASYEGAVTAFAKFREEAEKLKFKVRPLVVEKTDVKGTRIINTHVEPVELIKIFAVSPTGIALTDRHREKLVEVLKAKGVRSTTGARRVSTLKSVCKAFLRQLVGEATGTPRPVRGSSSTGEGVVLPLPDRDPDRGSPSTARDPEGSPSTDPAGPSQVLTGTSGNNNRLEGHRPGPAAPPSPSGAGGTTLASAGVTGTDSPLIGPPAAEEGSPYVASVPMSSSSGSGASSACVDVTATAPRLAREAVHNARVSIGGVHASDDILRPVTGAMRETAAPRRPTEAAAVSSSVTGLNPDHIKTLRDGRRLKVGDTYEGKKLDLTFLGDLDTHRRGEAFRQCLRVGSHHGVTLVVVPPGASWLAEFNLAGRPTIAGWKLCQRTYDAGWLHLKLRRVKPEAVMPPAAPPPDAELVIERVWPDCSTPTTYHVVHRHGEDREHTTRTEAGTLVNATALLVVAKLIAEKAPATVVLPATRGWSALLVTGTAKGGAAKGPRHVALHDAIKILSGWGWRMSESVGWVLGNRW